MKIASWNVENRLTARAHSSRGTPLHILEEIKKLDADILVLPEAYSKKPEVGVDDYLRELGYVWHDARYDERTRPGESIDTNDLYLRVLSRFPFIETKPLRWNNERNTVSVTIQDPETKLPIRVIAVHLDDRTEKSRLCQIDEAITYVNSSDLPTVMLGDFNAMHTSLGAKILSSRIVRVMAAFIPHFQFRIMATRLSEMALGATLLRLENETSLREVDVKHRPTATPKMHAVEWMPSICLAQIDHIFVTPNIEASNFHISKDGGSDHRAIFADIVVKSQ